jgi:hypothetical protein
MTETTIRPMTPQDQAIREEATHIQRYGEEQYRAGFEAGARTNEAKLKLWPELVKAALAFRELTTCYRIGRRATHKLLDELVTASETLAKVEAIEALAAEGGEVQCSK